MATIHDASETHGQGSSCRGQGLDVMLAGIENNLVSAASIARASMPRAQAWMTHDSQVHVLFFTDLYRGTQATRLRLMRSSVDCTLPPESRFLPSEALPRAPLLRATGLSNRAESLQPPVSLLRVAALLDRAPSFRVLPLAPESSRATGAGSAMAALGRARCPPCLSCHVLRVSASGRADGVRWTMLCTGDIERQRGLREQRRCALAMLAAALLTPW